MLTTRTSKSVVALMTAAVLLLAPIFVSQAQAGYVDGVNGNQQNIGYQVEEGYPGGYIDYGNCFGACGPGCSYTCGGGGACQTHDFYMRKHGLWSWQQFATFPPALVQWGACMTWRGIEYIGSYIYSKVTGALSWLGKKIAGIFN